MQNFTKGIKSLDSKCSASRIAQTSKETQKSQISRYRSNILKVSAIPELTVLSGTS